MPDPTTTNRALFIPNHNADIGTWDTPMNANFNALDTLLGAVTTVALTNVNVTLSSAQYANGTIKLTGTLTGNVTVTFPSVAGWWTVDNRTTGNFYVLLSCGGGNNIGAPPGAFDVYADGTNMNYRNLGKVGFYEDFAGSAVPLWVSASTIPPYLNCDGSTFNAATYPVLNQILGGNTLPDRRGRSGICLDQGTGRIGNVITSTLLNGGGNEQSTLTQGNLPNVTFNGNSGSFLNSASLSESTVVLQNVLGSAVTVLSVVTLNKTTGTPNVASGGSGTAFSNLPPMMVFGITMIRAA